MNFFFKKMKRHGFSRSVTAFHEEARLFTKSHAGTINNPTKGRVAFQHSHDP